MAANSQILVHTPSYDPPQVKELLKANNLTSIPSQYIFSDNKNSDDQVIIEDQFPIIDYSLLTSGTPEQRSKTIHDLGNACEEWGFFIVVNHGMQENLMQDMLKALETFFDLPEEEKKVYMGKSGMDPIRCGTSYDASTDKVFYWRDFLNLLVHPQYHSPAKPPGLSETCSEFSKQVREIALELMKGISQSLGLDENYIDKATKQEDGRQIMVGNIYPPCPEPELVMGFPPHSDHGVFTTLVESVTGGLQLKHKDKWVQVNCVPNAILVNTADQLEILSNGKYKSVLHRVMVSETTRISIATDHGPSLDAFVTPAPALLNDETNPPDYQGTTFKEFLEYEQCHELRDKNNVDRLRIN